MPPPAKPQASPDPVLTTVKKGTFLYIWRCEGALPFFRGWAVSGVREPILAMRGISKRFGAVQALSEVDLDVYAGEVVALVGDNGAGKSTLVKAICGVSP